MKQTRYNFTRSEEKDRIYIIIHSLIEQVDIYCLACELIMYLKLSKLFTGASGPSLEPNGVQYQISIVTSVIVTD